MHFFANHHFERESYKNGFDFTNYEDDLEKLDTIIGDEKLKRSLYSSNRHYKTKNEYVVMWYREQIVTQSNKDNALIYVDVLLADLTDPLYQFSKDDKIYVSDSFITVQIPINFLHKMPIGSIWLNGQSKERFVCETFDVEIEKNYQIYSIYQALSTQYFDKYGKSDGEGNAIPYNGDVYPTPFDFKQYFDKINNKDRNQLINIEYDGLKFVLHPFLLFITLYGYSMDIKRIISRYSIEDINKALMPENKEISALAKAEGIEKYVILPKNFTQRDAVFLYHYKYDANVRKLVEQIHTKIQNNKTDNTKVIKIDFWHKSISLRLRGIRIDDKILCTSIAGIGEIQGEAINVYLQPKKKVDTKSDTDRKFSVLTRYLPPERIEELDFVRNPVNSIVQGVLKERLVQLGEGRNLNIHRPEVMINPVGESTQFINYDELDSLSVGEKQGQKGTTGYANCFFELDENGTGTSRYAQVWQYTKDYAKSVGGKAQWFSYKKEFSSDDDYHLMSLSNFHSVSFGFILPKNVLVIRVVIGNEVYFVIEFGEDYVGKTKKTYSGIAYKQSDNEDFVNDESGLPELLLKAIEQDGIINSDFIDSYKGRIATFQHREGKDNNWVKNGIEKLR